ncbi:luciferin 4-monooxygenase-like [Onthophagus taurus]|uniref:luciferin 4-monooxygenase-like n=1 Tax=Onthophagus taurus TaxID=166361 RepID=UPI0039BEBE47
MGCEDDIILPDQGDNIIRTKKSDANYDPKGVAHSIFVSLSNKKHEIGQIDANTGEEETFGVTLQKAIRIACHLKSLGVTPNDIITPCTTNHLNAAAIFHAILFTGAKPAGMDPFAPDEDRIRQLELVEPKLIFAIPETVKALENMIDSLGLNTKIIVFGKTDIHIPFEDLLVPLPEEEKNFTPYIVDDVHEPALIVFSSGTTGSPKGICISHYSVMGNFGNVLLPNNDPQIFLSYASFVWASAIVITVTTALVGGIKVQASGFTPEKAWRHLEKYKVSVFFAAPQDLIALIKNGKPKGLKLPHLKMLCPAGGPISIPSYHTLQEMFPDVTIFTGFGQTELFNCALVPDFSPSARTALLSRPTTCGKPTRGSTYKIVDPDTGKILGPNQPGELCVLSDMNMIGYYKQDSSERFDEDGFLKTGDILYYDEEKWFFFVERSKEMLRYKMTAIAPTEIEHILIQHPSVKLAVVIGKPTDEGDITIGVVVRKDKNVTDKELEDLVASNVDERKRIRGGIYFVDESEIPFTPSGKIKRRSLKRYILEKIQN